MNTQNASSRWCGTALAYIPCFCFLVFSSAVHAGTINHGDFAGDTVMYLDVTETSAKPVPLFGTPTTIGDALSFFQPGASPDPSLGFSAIAPPSDTTDGFLSFGVMAKSGFGITTLGVFSEEGDYSMSALGAALAQVSANLIVQEIAITHVDGIALTTPVTSSSIDSVAFNLPGDPAVGIWDLSAIFDVDQLLMDANVPFNLGATKITIKLDNTLQALAEPSAAASIIKKAFDVDVETRGEIPEPGTAALLMLMASLVGATYRRK